MALVGNVANISLKGLWANPVQFFIPAVAGLACDIMQWRINIGESVAYKGSRQWNVSGDSTVNTSASPDVGLELQYTMACQLVQEHDLANSDAQTHW